MVVRKSNYWLGARVVGFEYLKSDRAKINFEDFSIRVTDSSETYCIIS